MQHNYGRWGGGGWECLLVCFHCNQTSQPGGMIKFILDNEIEQSVKICTCAARTEESIIVYDLLDNSVLVIYVFDFL